MSKIFSNLNLNGPTPVRVQPRLGEWGPNDVPSTRQKKRLRIIVPIVAFGVTLVVFFVWWFVWHLLTGLIGFGLD